MKKLIYILSFITCLIIANPGYSAFSTAAESVYLVDYDSGSELITKNSDKLMPPSSMIKLMTLLVLFDAVKAGDIDLDDQMTVSENADYKNPIFNTASKICLEKDQKLKVSDAITGIIVLSGGDATVVVAEKLAGSEQAFTKKMEQKARSIGMNKSTFGNASGLPSPDNLMTTKELGILGMHIISDYPEFYPEFASQRFEFNHYNNDWCREWGRTHTLNYNKLLFIMPGADGMKTGHTENGGYGMVASAKVGGRRLVAVINGYRGKNHNALAAEMKRLLMFGFTETTNKTFYKPGDKIAEIPVWYGRKKTVVATVAKPFAVTIPKGQSTDEIRIIARYNEPLPAPIKKGDKVGEIIAYKNNQIIARTPLVAEKKVGKNQLFGRVFKNIGIILGGKK